MKDLAQIGRLALRQEGQWWVAYYALPDSMDKAIKLGSVLLATVENEQRRDEFIGFMRNVVSDFIARGTGIIPSWPDGPKPAPEHERSGNG